MSSASTDRSALASRVETLLAATPVTDIHTHLYDPAFGELLRWGIDDLLVYHYLIAESFRWVDAPYDKFWALTKKQQADLIWEALFVRHSPISEACRGVITSLHALGLEPRKGDLAALPVAWGDTAPLLSRWGYKVGGSLTDETIGEVRRFLADWTKKIDARYLMVSLPPDFEFP